MLGPHVSTRSSRPLWLPHPSLTAVLHTVSCPSRYAGPIVPQSRQTAALPGSHAASSLHCAPPGVLPRAGVRLHGSPESPKTPSRPSAAGVTGSSSVEARGVLVAPTMSSERRSGMGQLSRRSPTVGQLAQYPSCAAQQEPSRAVAGPGADAGPSPPPAQLPWAGSGGSTLPARGGGGGDAGGRPPVRPSVSGRRTPAAPPPTPSQPEYTPPATRKPPPSPPAHEALRRTRVSRQRTPQKAPNGGQGGHMAAEHEAEALLQGVRWAGSDSESDSEEDS